MTDEQIWRFAQDVQRLPGMPKDAVVQVSFGRRFARIYKEWGSQSLCWGFVDKTNGDVRRGGWKAPDMRVPPHTSLHAKDLMDRVDWTGPKYHKIQVQRP